MKQIHTILLVVLALMPSMVCAQWFQTDVKVQKFEFTGVLPNYNQTWGGGIFFSGGVLAVCSNLYPDTVFMYLSVDTGRTWYPSFIPYPVATGGDLITCTAIRF